MNPFVRGLFAYFFIGALFVGTVFILFPAPCSTPIVYTIGELNPKFRLSKEEFLKDIERAEKMWEQEIGKELFVYDVAADFTINLVYDERQAVTDTQKKITQSLEKTSQNREGILKQYGIARDAYDAAAIVYKEHRRILDTDSTAFRAKIQQYNQSGGATPDEYTALKHEQKTLNDRADNLEQERLDLNGLAVKVNALADTESSIVTTYNKTVQKFNDEFSEQREFDQGEYTGNAITIYEFMKNDDLVLVLAHEMGHALGIGHVQNPAAVMYYMVHEKNLNVKKLAASDTAALVAQCNKSTFTLFWEQLNKFDIRGTLKKVFNS